MRIVFAEIEGQLCKIYYDPRVLEKDENPCKGCKREDCPSPCLDFVDFVEKD